jgi:hypothetical protein
VRSATASCDKKHKPKTKAAAVVVTSLEGAAQGFQDETAAVFGQLQQEEVPAQLLVGVQTLRAPAVAEPSICSLTPRRTGGGGDRRSPDWPHVTVLHAYVAQHPDELNLVEDETVTIVPLANAAEKDDAWSTITWQAGAGANILPGPRRQWGRLIPDDILALSDYRQPFFV